MKYGIIAAFEGNPYKYWIHGKGGVMHVFLKEWMPGTGEHLVAEDPNSVELCHTWMKFVHNYLTTAKDGVVLHAFTDEFDDLEREWYESILPDKCELRFEAIDGHGGKWCDVQFVPKHDIDHRDLFTLMHDLYDVYSNEWWECDTSTGWETKNLGLVVTDYEEILAA